MKIPESTNAAAEFWGVDRKTIARWKHAGLDYTNIGAMCDHYTYSRRIPDALMGRIFEVKKLAEAEEKAAHEETETEERNKIIREVTRELFKAGPCSIVDAVAELKKRGFEVDEWGVDEEVVEKVLTRGAPVLDTDVKRAAWAVVERDGSPGEHYDVFDTIQFQRKTRLKCAPAPTA